MHQKSYDEFSLREVLAELPTAFRNGAPTVKHKIPVHERPQSPNLAKLSRRRRQEGAAFMPEAELAFGPEPKPFRFRSRPCLHVSGKVRFTSAAGHLPSVRGRLAGRLHDAWSNPVPECPSELRARTRQRASATRQLTTSSGTASRGDVRGRVASQEAEPAPSFFITGRRSGEAMLMPDRVPSPARG